MPNNMSKTLKLLALVVILPGCALVPYNNEFACEGDAEYGKCTDVSGAYNESVTGEPAGPKMRKDGNREFADQEYALKKENALTNIPVNSHEAYRDYKSSVYQKLTKLIDEPNTTPMVKQPTQVRTLILNYTTGKTVKKMYMPRYVYYFIDDYEFVLDVQHRQSKNANFTNIYDAE